MINFKQISLKLRLFLGIGFLLTSIFIGMSFFNYWEGKRVIMQQIFEVELPTFTDNVYYKVNERLNRSTYLGSSLADNHFVKNWFANPKDTFMLDMLYDLEQKHKINVISIIHDSLQKVYSDRKIVSLNPEIRRDDWYYALKNMPIQKNFNLYNDPIRKKLMFFVNHKVYDQDSTYLGVVGLGTELDSMLKESLRNKSPLKTNIYITDGKGIIKIQKDVTEKFITDNYENIGQLDGIKGIASQILKRQDSDLSYRSEKGTIFVRTKYFTEFDWYVILEVSEEEIFSPMRSIFFTNLILAIFIITFGASGTYFYAQSISNPISRLTELAQQISLGNINVQYKHRPIALEIDQLAEAFQKMLQNLQNIVGFADQIQKGNINTQFEKVSAKDQLGESLLAMQKSLQKNHEENQIRSWINEGISHFAAMFRTNNIEAILDDFMKDLVKKVNANQAGIFLLNEKQNSLQLSACYAYQRKKFLEKEITVGQGILGQTFLEKKSYYLKNIPQNYTLITSGLGQATPNALLLVPLVFNQKAVGIIELATFNEFLPHHIHLIEKVGEAFASVLISFQSGQQTQTLYRQMQVSTENLRSQEEEMRQNLEELMATQEEASRKEQEYIRKITDLENQLAQVSKKINE